MLLRQLELLILLGIPTALMLAWRRPPPGGRRSPAVTALLSLLAVGTGLMVLIGIGYAVESSRQDRRDPSAEFAGLGTALGAGFAVVGGVLFLTFVAALIIRARRK